MTAQLSLWTERTHPATWDDVHRGDALLVTRTVPCDHCYTHWHDGRCDNTPDRYAFPMSNGDGTCDRHFTVWPEEVRPGDTPIERGFQND